MSGDKVYHILFLESQVIYKNLFNYILMQRFFLHSVKFFVRIPI